MKKIILSVFIAVFILEACSPKTSKSTTATTTAVAPPTVNSEPNEAMLTAIKTRFSDATIDDLQKGKEIYYGACTHCHGAKSIVKREEQEWTSIMDEMAPKAKLNTKERENVWKYIMGVKLSSTAK